MSTTTAIQPEAVLHTHRLDSNDTISREEFASAMRRFPSGVVIVTTLVDGRPWGVTLSSLSSFSGEPARVAFSISKSTATAQHLREHGTFGVAILSDAASGIAARQAAPGQPKFLDEHPEGVRLGDVLGMPLISEAVTNLECTVVLHLEVLDHLLVVADVVSMSDGLGDAGGLVYVNREFGRFAGVGR